MLLTVSGLQAGTLWNNGALTGTATICDGGPGTCSNSSSTAWTIFDNFTVPTSSVLGWLVSSFDYTDQFANTPAADYKDTSWSIWNGDPLSGGKLVASGLTLGSLTLLSGTCATSGNPVSTCTNRITINLTTTVYLSPGATYYLGTSNVLASSNDNTYRDMATGGNTTTGITNPIVNWEQSNGSTTGTVGSGWAAGSTNNDFTSGATSFDLYGVVGAPEPGTLTLLGITLAGLCFIRRRKAA